MKYTNETSNKAIPVDVTNYHYLPLPGFPMHNRAKNYTCGSRQWNLWFAIKFIINLFGIKNDPKVHFITF